MDPNNVFLGHHQDLVHQLRQMNIRATRTPRPIISLRDRDSHLYQTLETLSIQGRVLRPLLFKEVTYRMIFVIERHLLRTRDKDQRK